jgi:pimeloyl-ACP methyl ester carboxylesterase
MNTRFNFLIIVLFLITNQITLAQANWVSYSQSIQAQNYEGLHFRLQASIKTEIDDDSASARLWIRVEKKNRGGFFENMWFKPIRNKDWDIYSIEGKIDSGAFKVAFGALCQYNGKFFYDNIRLDIKTNENQWKNVFLEDFKDGVNSLKQGVNHEPDVKHNVNYNAEIHKENEAKGNQCLLIVGKGVPNFGVNNKVGKHASVNGIKLYYEVYGEGQPLVVLHGNGGSIKSATPHYPHLIKKYKVIAIDSRAQGRSTDTNTPLTYEQMASDVNALLEQLKVDSVLIWGQSDGAIIGLILAMEYPEKVKKILAFGANIQPDSTAVFQYAIDYDKEKLQNSNNETKRKLYQLMLDYPNIPYSKLSQIKAPILIMAGDRDVIRPEHTLKLFQNIPNSHLCIIPGSTHGASWAKKELFLILLDEFFEKPFYMPDTKQWYQK